MKTSVIVIAHNEETHIAHCIESLLHQTQRPDEIVVLAHNCTDQTEAISRRFPVTVVPFNGPAGAVHARIESLAHVSGDAILCTDADSYVASNWVRKMGAMLEHNTLAGSWVRFQGTAFGSVANLFNYFLCVWPRYPERWVWGASMAFRGSDKEFIRSVFERSIELSKQLQLSRNPEDYWLALFMTRHGSVAVTNKTWVAVRMKEQSSGEAFDRHSENINNGDRMEAYFNAHPELR